MNSKRVVGVLIMFFLLMASVYAKQKLQPQQQITVDTIVAKMKKQLELTDKQAVEVKPIIEDYLLKEEQLKLEEKKQLAKVLTGDQLFTWNFLQNEKPQEKEKKKRK